MYVLKTTQVNTFVLYVIISEFKFSKKLLRRTISFLKMLFNM